MFIRLFNVYAINYDMTRDQSFVRVAKLWLVIKSRIQNIIFKLCTEINRHCNRQVFFSLFPIEKMSFSYVIHRHSN